MLNGRRRVMNKRAPEGQPDAEEPSTKEARKDEDAKMDCLAAMVRSCGLHGQSADCSQRHLARGRAGDDVEDLDPYEREARMIEIRNIENQETFEEVYLDDDMKMISGKWVDTEKILGIAKAR